jgi:hypothetical protein
MNTTVLPYSAAFCGERTFFFQSFLRCQRRYSPIRGKASVVSTAAPNAHCVVKEFASIDAAKDSAKTQAVCSRSSDL